jgi:hypothetical protein
LRRITAATAPGDFPRRSALLLEHSRCLVCPGCCRRHRRSRWVRDGVQDDGGCRCSPSPSR